MIDVEAVERAENSIDKFLSSRSKGREKANAEAALQKAEDLRRLQAMRQEHRVLWVEHFRRLAACNLKAARDYRRRARRLENGENA